MNTITKLLEPFPRVTLAQLPTPIQELPHLSEALGGPTIYVKRDDCTGLALGGNKARQLEYYFGDAQKRGADVVLITGAVQSNYVRMTAAAARQLGMESHIQLEERVPDVDDIYHHSGNVLLDRIFGACLHSYPHGEDEAGADHRLEQIADELRHQGKHPYIIYLGPDRPPLGALGYVHAAEEILTQIEAQQLTIGEVVIASGSSYSHSGLLVGLRTRGSRIGVTGICVRRKAALQVQRVTHCMRALEQLLNLKQAVTTRSDICVFDGTLAPGYGRLNSAAIDAIRTLAQTEGILLDPVYTGKSFAGLLALIKANKFAKTDNVLFVHTGGAPALFAYEPALRDALRA